MNVSDFFKKVRILTRSNSVDFPDSEIALLADMEADYLYELSIQGEHLEQTENQQPTVLTYTVTDNFVETPHNLWIERVEYSKDGVKFKTLTRTNKTEYETILGCRCDTNSLTNDLVDIGCADYFIQTSQGIHVFQLPNTTGKVKIYVKDSPVINWTDPNYEILMPKVPTNMLAIATALMYRDIENTNEYDKLFAKYTRWLETMKKRIGKGSRTIQMRTKGSNKKVL